MLCSISRYVALLGVAVAVMPRYPAWAQFTVAIPPNAIVVNSTQGSSGVDKVFWICENDTLTGSGVDMTYFLEKGASFSGSGISKNAYMKTLSSIGGSGIDDSIWHEPGANMMLNPAYDSLCTAVVFDYTDAPVPGCPATTGLAGDARVIRINVYPNPATDRVTLESTDAGVLIESVELSDKRGRKVMRMESLHRQKISLSIAGRLPGLYVLRILTGRGTAVHFLAIE
jgi:hypothetical protein